MTTKADHLQQVTDETLALMEKIWGPNHIYGPEDVDALLAMLAMIAASQPAAMSIVARKMSDLMNALLDTMMAAAHAPERRP